MKIDKGTPKQWIGLVVLLILFGLYLIGVDSFILTVVLIIVLATSFYPFGKKENKDEQ